MPSLSAERLRDWGLLLACNLIWSSQFVLVKIVQEATRNAIRYSRAKEIEMHIVYLDTDSIRVQLHDDGCGFDLEQASLKSGHWGLTTMRERAQQIGAELKICSTPGHGTELEIVAPIKSPET